jgi:hypothetical protein
MVNPSYNKEIFFKSYVWLDKKLVGYGEGS